MLRFSNTSTRQNSTTDKIRLSVFRCTPRFTTSKLCVQPQLHFVKGGYLFPVNREFSPIHWTSCSTVTNNSSSLQRCMTLARHSLLRAADARLLDRITCQFVRVHRQIVRVIPTLSSQSYSTVRITRLPVRQNLRV